MTNTPLADLDELVLLCRDERARLYIIEAVACYRAGAYRSSIVAAWIAVCYDIIDKLRELALAGDKAALQLTEAVEQTRRANDTTRSLNIERGLLEVARDQFELISHLEHIDLQRLQEDRNRCAHPSLVAEGQGFNPPGELARLHIRSAVTHLLQHPPVQGKYALDRLLSEVKSEYFPDNVKHATASLSSGPLKRPRASLVRNFTIVLIKRAIQEPLRGRARRQVLAALGAVSALHTQEFESTLEERLSDLFRRVEDDRLAVVIPVLERIPDCWHHLAVDVQQRLENFARRLPAAALEALEFLLEYPPLATQAAERLAVTTPKELLGMSYFITPPKVADRFIDVYLRAGTYAEANTLAPLIARSASDLAADQLRRLIEGMGQNDQIYDSFEAASVISSLRQTGALRPAEFETLLKSNRLVKYAINRQDEGGEVPAG